jgi:hypothetical protein
LKLKVMLLVVDVPEAPTGRVHWYDVAPGTSGVQNILPVELRQAPYAPLMADGVAGAPPVPLLIVAVYDAVQP